MPATLQLNSWVTGNIHHSYLQLSLRLRPPDPLSFRLCKCLAPGSLVLSTALTSSRPGSKSAGFTTMKQPSQYPLNNSYVQQGEMINIIPSCHLNSYTQLLFPRGRPIFIFKYHLFHVCLSFYPVTRLSVPPPPTPNPQGQLEKALLNCSQSSASVCCNITGHHGTQEKTHCFYSTSLFSMRI